jgi:hypothetical protein
MLGKKAVRTLQSQRTLFHVVEDFIGRDLAYLVEEYALRCEGHSSTIISHENAFEVYYNVQHCILYLSFPVDDWHISFRGLDVLGQEIPHACPLMIVADAPCDIDEMLMVSHECIMYSSFRGIHVYTKDCLVGKMLLTEECHAAVTPVGIWRGVPHERPVIVEYLPFLHFPDQLNQNRARRIILHDNEDDNGADYHVDAFQVLDNENVIVAVLGRFGVNPSGNLSLFKVTLDHCKLTSTPIIIPGSDIYGSPQFLVDMSWMIRDTRFLYRYLQSQGVLVPEDFEQCQNGLVIRDLGYLLNPSDYWKGTNRHSGYFYFFVDPQRGLVFVKTYDQFRIFY